MSHSPFTPRLSSDSPSHETNTQRPANFLAKLYAALHDDHNAKQAMYWSSDGNQLVVADPKLLETSVLPVHYKHCKFTSFCRQLNIYGFARVYPGRHFEDARGNMLTNASVWAHPTLHRDSTMEELMAVKRRAPPRLFRNRRQTNERSPSQRPVETQWRRRQPFQSGRPSAFLPALDLELPRTSPAFQHESFWSGKREMRGNAQAMHPQTDDGATRPCFLSESAQWANLPDQTDERGQVSAIGAVSAMPLHYIIAPEIRPLQVPSPGPKPLPSPSVFEQWDPETSANIPHHLPYAVKVPHATSDSCSAMLHQQPYYSAQDLVNPLGQRIATLRPSYLYSDRQVYQDVEL
ncbi:HSF-type DNA-binding-domain-containing protein [Filobasidium floriforme]|uniref:HSF-type DNA-binding-domain-containing protein n=1 Tax=Filobasidium floriforme TaxID=5210 RepID=UPI001E8ED35E|nr:HSF-type DNA-binding-domain-containing protein [Filobasidium floriforme]KAH8083182.1 HSF-type DNA-binding-domain-containing protein [Filobasidium floriforme]